MNRKISFWTVNSSGSNNLYTPTINDEQWYYVVGTRNANTGLMRLYLNGLLLMKDMEQADRYITIKILFLVNILQLIGHTLKVRFIQ